MGTRISGWLKATVASVALVAGIASGGQGSLTAASSSAATPGDHAPACGTPAAGHARCGAIELLNPSQNWHPGPNAAAPSKKPGSGSTTTAPSGYYPADLQSAYNLAGALSSMTKPGGATIAVVDAYNDPYAATDLAAYRSTMNAATDPRTNLTGTKIPPLCSSTTSPGCVTFKKVNQSGGTSYPKGNTGWGEEISLDLDMISAICPNCNITLVEASSSSFSNLNAAVAYAKSLHPAAVTNSYGGSEFSSETSYNANYSYSPSSSGGATAVTAATGDSGYGVEFPAAAPNLTAVGGTSLTYTGTGATLAWNPQTVWSGAGAGCSAYETMPSWQDTSAFDVSSVCASRQVGDVSAVADPNTGVAVYDTYSEPGWMVFGGTSASTQIIGAMYGLAAGAGVEQPSPAGLYQGTGVVAVTSGSDGSCGTYLCQAGTGRLSSGYAGPVGVGVPDGIGAFSAATAGSLSFSPSSETATAGQPTGSLKVNLSAPAPSGGVTVNLATSSSGGSFSTSSTGGFNHTLSLTVAGGATATGTFYYEDTVAGTSTVTASAPGWTTGNLSVTVDPGPLASITVSPSSATVAEGATQTFTATGADSYGNPVVVDPSWTTTVSGGAVSPSSGSSTTFTAGSTSGAGAVTATQNGVSGSASVTVSSLAAMTVTVTNGLTVRKGPNYRTPVTVTAADATTLAPLSGANVALDVFSGSCSTGTLVSSGSGTTGSNGQVTFTFTTKSQGTYCAVATATYSGYSTGTSQDSFTN